MKFELKYKNDNPDFSISTTRIPAFDEGPIYVKIDESKKYRNDRALTVRKQQEALADVMVNIEYLLRDLKVMYNTDIESIKISETVLGDYIKTSNDVQKLTKGEVNVYDMIVYSFFSDVFAEKLLFTRNNDALVSRDSVNLEFDGNLIHESIIGKGESTEKDVTFIALISTTIRRFLPQYNLKYDADKKEFIYTYKGARLQDIEDIKEDDVFLFFKFVEVLLTKPEHFGLFFIDCSVFSTKVLHALVTLIDLNYMNGRLVFLYNSQNESKLKVIGNLQTLKFPNHKIPMADV